jgi:hypothetical protein
MDKYLIILIIIIILYFIQKYCIQSEVEQILITKNIIEKFTDSNINSLLSNVVNNLQQTNRLDLSGSLIINNRHKLTSDGNYLKLTDVSGQNFLNMSVKNLDVSGELLVRQNSTFTGGPHNFNFLNIDTSDNNAGIKSVQANLTINGSTKILGNTDISGNLRINNVKPILIKIFTTTGNIIDTGISHSTYSGIGFSGYNHPTSSSTRTPLEFNTYKQNGNWFVSFSPSNNQSTSIRLIFFNTFFHSDSNEIFNVQLTAPNITASIVNGNASINWTSPSSTGISYTVNVYNGNIITTAAIRTISNATPPTLVTGLSPGPYTFTLTAIRNSQSVQSNLASLQIPTAEGLPSISINSDSTNSRINFTIRFYSDVAKIFVDYGLYDYQLYNDIISYISRDSDGSVTLVKNGGLNTITNGVGTISIMGETYSDRNVIVRLVDGSNEASITVPVYVTPN